MDLQARFESARDYLQLRVSPPWGQDWQAGISEYFRGGMSLPAAMSLCHNSSWSQLAQEQGLTADAIEISVQGPKTFGGGAIHGAQCQSLELFGYECPFTAQSPQRDHLFPYALGGPTDPASNMTVLCAYHNRGKGMDIHVFPWEKPEPEWLEVSLRRLAKELRVELS